MPSLKFNLVTSALQKTYPLQFNLVGAPIDGVLPTLPLNMSEFLQVAVVGASILNSVTESPARRSYINDQIEGQGFTSRVYDRATSGNTSADTLAELQGGLLDDLLVVADKTLVVVHTGGNDVSAGNPESTLDANLRAIYQFIIGAGFKVMPTPISYRTSPTLDPSAPYNTNVVLPLITEELPEWIPGGIPAFDMYKLTSDNPSYLSDGIHLTEAGKTALSDLIATTITGNINISTPPATTYVKDLFINFGATTPFVVGAFSMGNNANSPIVVSKNTDGSTITSATQITLTNAQDFALGRTDQAANILPDVLNNESLEEGVYTDGDILNVDLSQAGLNPVDTYTVKLSASRDTTGTDRVGEYTLGGITQELDAAANPVEVLTFSGVSGLDIINDGLDIALKVGSIFAYITSLQITKE